MSYIIQAAKPSFYLKALSSEWSASLKMLSQWRYGLQKLVFQAFHYYHQYLYLDLQIISLAIKSTPPEAPNDTQAFPPPVETVQPKTVPPL
jgi:hypothetical protein